MADCSRREQDAATAGLTAAWLRLGKSIDQLSLALLLAALVVSLCADLVVHSRLALLVVVIAGIVEKGLAVRVELDAAIFADWAASWRNALPAAPEQTLQQFDAALAAVTGRHRAPAARPLADRVRGALVLFRRQAALVIVQAAGWLAALLCGFL